MVVFVVDSNVFIHGNSVSLPFENMVTVPEVTMELESSEAVNRFENEDVQIKEPSEKTMEKIRRKSKQISSDISETDLKLLSLAKEEGGVLVTDDYHMQNLAEKTGIKWQGFMKEGIEKGLEWVRKCDNCGREVETKKCGFCSSDTSLVSK